MNSARRLCFHRCLYVCVSVSVYLRLSQGRILVEIVGEVENKLGEVQQSSSRPPWKVIGLKTGQRQRRDVCM
jgi:hypothetical protein